MAENPRQQLRAAVDRWRGPAAADAICTVCAALPHIADAAIAVVIDGAHGGTLGASSPAARGYDEVAFVVGDGPCLSVTTASEGLAAFVDLTDTGDTRWPLYRAAMPTHAVTALTVLPITIFGAGKVGALTMFHRDSTSLRGEPLATARLAAHLAQLTLLDLLELTHAANLHPGGPAWRALQHSAHTEIAQATGMLMVQLHLNSRDALARLRAHSFTTTTPIDQLARAIIDHHLRLDPRGDPAARGFAASSHDEQPCQHPDTGETAQG